MNISFTLGSWIIPVIVTIIGMLIIYIEDKNSGGHWGNIPIFGMISIVVIVVVWIVWLLMLLFA